MCTLWMFTDNQVIQDSCNGQWQGEGGGKLLGSTRHLISLKFLLQEKKKLIELYILMLCRYSVEIYIYVDVMERVYLQGHVVLGQGRMILNGMKRSLEWIPGRYCFLEGGEVLEQVS